MTFVPHLRRVLKVGLVATAFVFANGQAPAPPLPAAPPIALAEPLLREAAAYQA
jgi:hypothetical protein